MAPPLKGDVDSQYRYLGTVTPRQPPVTFGDEAMVSVTSRLRGHPSA
jgi:hypothetical protein